MAITQTGAMYKSLSFDNTSSRNYGVYITGEAVYNAPERAVEMISIPGRNGSFALDQGRFENIEVKYPAGIFAETEADFAQAVSDFRNFLCSKKGYCRLTDEYNPNEYRMAVYKSGLEVNPKQLRAGEFNIVFECKPQRFLTSGETSTAVASGGSITNPTGFKALPLIEIEGTGKATVNGKSVKIQNSVVGDVIVVNRLTSYGRYYLADFSSIYIATGNSIVTGDIDFGFTIFNSSGLHSFTSQSISNITGNPDLNPTATGDGLTVEVSCSLDDESYSYGTAASKTIGFDVTVTNDASETATVHIEVTAAYDGNKQIEFLAQIGHLSDDFYIGNPAFSFGGVSPAITIHSTAATFGNPTYIDCETGEAYTINNGVVSSLNRYIQLGADLPVLDPGANAVTFDNTVTTLKITPRWWKV